MFKKILFCVGISLSTQNSIIAAASGDLSARTLAKSEARAAQSRRSSHSSRRIKAQLYTVPEKIVHEAGKNDALNTQIFIKKVGINTTDVNGNTALHLAAQQGLQKVITFLIAEGAKINAQNNNLDTPLHLAAAKGYFHTLKILRNAGADLNISNKQGNRAYDIAIACDYLRSARTIPYWKGLPRMGAPSIIEPVEASSSSPADEIAQAESSSTPHYIRRSRDKKLINAVTKGCYRSTFNIIRRGVPLDEGDEDGNTALHIAAQNGSYDIVRLLMKKESPLDLQNNDGDTPLHLATLWKHTRIMRLLVRHGANPDIKNIDGDTPRDISLTEGCSAVFEQK